MLCGALAGSVEGRFVGGRAGPESVKKVKKNKNKVINKQNLLTFSTPFSQMASVLFVWIVQQNCIS